MTPGPAVPDPTLVAASAMVFVGDPSAPVVDSADARHLLDVLRLRPGELVVAADGAGRWAPCRVSPSAGRRSRDVDLADVLVADGPTALEPGPAPPVTVAFAPVKGDRPEWVVQKLTELGVDRIVPLRTARSVVRWDGERGERTLDRLRKVVREASAQSRRPRLPELTAVATLATLATVAGGQPCLADPGGVPLGPGQVVVAVGPEGGWDDGERSGLPLVGLGPTVLRAETAAVVAGAYLCGLRAGTVAAADQVASPRPLRNT